MLLLRDLMDLENDEFGPLLRTLRQKACLTQEELAERSGVSIRAICDLERGRTKRPHRNSVKLLAEALWIEDDAFERFRQLARRKPGAAPVPPMRPLAGVDAVPAGSTTQRGLSPDGVAELIEWMRQVLVEEPARRPHQGGPEAAGPRVVQLVGDPGPQKAAVVVQASADFRRHFPDGQFYVNAQAGTSGPAHLASRLLQALGVGPAGQPPADCEVRRLRAALSSRRALLVLDNVVDADEVRPLLPTDGAGAVIVIARQRLDLLEGVWTVDFRSVGRCDGPTLPPVLMRAG